jgi:glycine/D-amino acid oxidase-like deaminating enzyme
VIGAGLAGSLAALALARHGATVTLVGPAPDPSLPADPLLLSATSLSYGSLLGWGPIRHWRRLERLHGPLGLRRHGLVLHGWPFPLAGWPPALLALATAPLPFARVDPPALMAALPGALAAAGVRRCERAVHALERPSAGPWQLRLEPGLPEGEGLEADRVVLAAGVGCRSLWPALPERLRFSWAGVLALSGNPGGSPWLEQARGGRVVQPRNWQRPALEAGAADLQQERWIVDAGLAPWGEGVVMGQISLVRPGVDPGDPPDPEWMESRLRQGLAGLDRALAALEGPYRQVAVPFCTDGQPLVGPVAGAEGLWVFTGFSGAFALVPSMAEDLAGAIQAG